MENEKEIYDYAYKLITEENKSSEEVIKLIIAKGIGGKDASNIYYNAFSDVKRKEEAPMNKKRAEALSQISKNTSSAQDDDYIYVDKMISDTRIYGRTEWEGLTFIATQWWSLGFVPIFPLGSYRLRLTDEEYSFMGDNRYDVYSKEKLNVKQVINTYLVWLIILSLYAWWQFFTKDII